MPRVGLAIVALCVFGVVAFGALLATTWSPPCAREPARFLVAPAVFEPTAPRRPGQRSVVLLVFDGLSRATFEAAQTPHLDRMVAEGAHTLDMRPVWPSVSLVNHFSLSTGCYPEHHGIVSNYFVDPERGQYNRKGDADWLLACEPLHVVAERQGLRSAVFAWVGNSSSSRGALASVVRPFAPGEATPGAQAQRVIAQLRRPAAERPAYIAAYVSEPDATAHRHGPLGQATLAVAAEADAAVGAVMAAIESLGPRAQVTLIVTTDHGMVPVDTVLNLPRMLRRAGVEGRLLASGTVAHVYLADPESRPAALAALGAVLPSGRVELVDPRAPPAGLRLGHSARVGDLLLLPTAGNYGFDEGYWEPYLRFLAHVGPDTMASGALAGGHGYDPARVPGVRSVFFAWGARVVRGAVVTRMDAVDLHPTVAQLLDMQPGSPVDGVARTDFVSPAGPEPVGLPSPLPARAEAE